MTVDIIEAEIKKLVGLRFLDRTFFLQTLKLKKKKKKKSTDLKFVIRSCITLTTTITTTTRSLPTYLVFFDRCETLNQPFFRFVVAAA